MFEQFKFKTTEKTNISQYLSLDKEFHDLFINHCDNQILIKLLSNIQERIHWLRGFSLNKQSFIQSAEEHLAIIQAIQIQDKELTSNNLVVHLREQKKQLFKK
jgi:DNA-binding GntR family transcriptional regulator